MRENTSNHVEQAYTEATTQRIEPTKFLTKHEEAITTADAERADGSECGFTVVMRILASETQSFPRERMMKEIEEEIRENQKLNDTVDEAEVEKHLQRYNVVVENLLQSGVLVEEEGILKLERTV
ncbi:MAG: hypothetical protein WCV85_05975 [Patescibacteria group bacterium]|jgi:hypothetical protein